MLLLKRFQLPPKPTIIFIPTYDYLSEKLFMFFTQKLSKYHTVYLNTEEFQPMKRNEELVRCFSEYVELSGDTQVSIRNVPIVSGGIRVCKWLFFHYKIRKAILSLNPSMIVVPSDLTIAFGMIKKLCKEKNIPVVVLQCAFFDADITPLSMAPRSWYIEFKRRVGRALALLPSQAKWGYEFEKSIVFVWGKKFAEYFSSQRDVRVVGSHLFHEKRTSSEKQLTKGDVALPFETIVTICTEAFDSIVSDEEYRKLYRLYAEIVEQNPHVGFLIKVHPREDMQNVKNALNINATNVSFIKTEYTLQQVYSISDIQMSVASASSLEAVADGLPIILVGNETVTVPNFFDNSIELRAETAAECTECIEKVLSPEWRKEFEQKRKDYLEYYLDFYNSPEDSFVDCIEDILGKNQCKYQAGVDR